MSTKPKTTFPPGWDEARVGRVLEHYESQSELEAVADDEAGLDESKHTLMRVPNDLGPVVRDLIAQRNP